MGGTMIYRKGRGRTAVPVNEIVLMEKERRKIILHTIDDRHEFYGRFDEVINYLDESFISPHRSYMLNMEHIVSIDSSRVLMKNGISLVLCRRCLSRLKKGYDEYISKNIAKN